MSKGSVFEKAKTLREKQHIVRDNGDNLYFEFINSEHWCQNQFQITHQITVEGTYKNRYDVTLLTNGLSLYPKSSNFITFVMLKYLLLK